MQDKDKRAAVARIGLFQGLSAGQLSALAGIAAARRLAQGQDAFQAGDAAHGFYAVSSGRIKVYRLSPSGKEQILHVFGPGEAFGEVPVFEGATFPASAQALEDCELLFFPRAGFGGIIRTDPGLAMKMLALLSARLRILVAKVEELSLKEVPARLAAYLLLLRASQKSDDLVLDLPKGQIASYLGTIQETLSRALKRLADQGAIAIKGKRVTVLNPEALQRLAEVGRGEG
jgi:CRP/FNR family transcriptional regulator